MDKMGYRQRLFIVYKHSDVNNTHVHIVSICIDDDRRKIKAPHEHQHSEGYLSETGTRIRATQQAETARDAAYQEFDGQKSATAEQEHSRGGASRMVRRL